MPFQCDVCDKLSYMKVHKSMQCIKAHNNIQTGDKSLKNQATQ